MCIQKGISLIRLGHATCSRDKISCLLRSVGGQRGCTHTYCTLYANLGESKVQKQTSTQAD
mgnify:FL=1|jgi:hypothetical protein